MSEIGAIRNAVRAERQLIQTERAAQRALPQNIGEVVPPKPKNVVKTAVGRDVDISRGYNVRGPDGTKIPFKVDTPIEKAKEWTKNFYRKESDFQISSDNLKLEIQGEENPRGWGVIEDWKTIRDRSDRKNYLQFADDDENKKVYVKMSYTSPASKGKGIGAGMYRVLFDRATKKGYKVESDTRMTKDSIAVWRRFKDMGYPVKENKIQPFEGRTGWFETKDGGPLFEFDPSQKGTSEVNTKGVRDPVAEIDKNKPHMKVAGEVPKTDEADQLIYKLRRQQGVSPEQREKILDAYNDYKVAEDPAQQQQLLEQLRTMIPESTK